MQGPDFARPSAENIEVLKRVSSASVTTILRRQGIEHCWMEGVKPLLRGMKVVGPAMTLRSVPGRADLQPMAYDEGTAFPHHPDDAIEAIKPGDILVHDGMNFTHECLWGDLLTTRLKIRGSGGLVTSMAMRDAPHLPETELAIFCRGTASPGSLVFSPDFNVPINCAGTLVLPGDIIVGDDDGVAVIPQSLIQQVVEEVLYHEEREVFLRKLLAEGARLTGVYPPNAETDRKFREWREQQRAARASATNIPAN